MFSERLPREGYILEGLVIALILYWLGGEMGLMVAIVLQGLWTLFCAYRADREGQR